MREPPWLTHLVDQRIALIEHAFAGQQIPERALIMTPLTEPPEGATPAQLERWERSCDNCRRHSPAGTSFYTGQLTRTLRDGHTTVHLTFGVCARCRNTML